MLVYLLPIQRDEQEVECRAVCLSDKEDGWDAAADAANRARAVRCELARIHHAEEAFAVHDLTDEGLSSQWNGLR